MKKKFTLPAFLLVFFGLALFIAVCISAASDSPRAHLWPLVSALLLIVIETMVYWLIQGRNTRRDASLVHVLLLMLACASLFLREGVFIYSISRRTPHPGRLLRRIDRVQYTLFAGFLIIAHLFFIRVLRSAFANQPQLNSPLDQTADL